MNRFSAEIKDAAAGLDRIIFRYQNDDDVSILILTLLKSINIPYRSFFFEENSTTEEILIKINAKHGIHSLMNEKYFINAALDSNGENSLIISKTLKNNFLKPKRAFINASIEPFCDLFLSEVRELLGKEPNASMEEFIIREDDRCGIITGGLQPPQHKEWFRYSLEQKTIIASLYNEWKGLRSPRAIEGLRKEGLVR